MGTLIYYGGLFVIFMVSASLAIRAFEAKRLYLAAVCVMVAAACGAMIIIPV